MGFGTGPNPELARQLRKNAQQRNYRIDEKWFTNQIISKIRIEMGKRGEIAARWLKNKIIMNIAKPVGTITGKSGKLVVTQRSLPGEYPRAETTQLMQSIFYEKSEDATEIGYFIGSTADYAMILELHLNRSFLMRTIKEQMPKVTRIMTGPGGWEFE